MRKNNIHPEIVEFSTSIDRLNFDPGNARVHDEKNIEAIKQSLSTFGQRVPIVVQRDGNIVRAGNGRLQAAIDLGWSRVAAVFVDDDDKTATAFAIADNRTGELASWNSEELLSSIKAVGEDLAVGFDSLDIEEIVLSSSSQIEKDLSSPKDSEDKEEDQNIDQLVDDILSVDSDALPTAGKVSKIDNCTLYFGDCVEVMQSMDDSSVDAIVTDPPYGIGFMNSNWDCDVPGAEWAKECLRVLKPGGHLVGFAATKTIHRLGVVLEDAGFEVRDLISWLFWSGFPKSKNISLFIDKQNGHPNRGGSIPVASTYQATDKNRENKLTSNPVEEYTPITQDAMLWHGWGTALKPAQEPAFLVRKPLEGPVAENILKHGTGGLNIDACRALDGDECWPGPGGGCNVPQKASDNLHFNTARGVTGSGRGETRSTMHHLGRWPANIYHSKKPSSSERDHGLDDLNIKPEKWTDGRKAKSDRPYLRAETERRNFHPTVKPIKLMSWLVRLVTPPGGVVLDTFVGSGTTCLAARREKIKSIGIEKDPRFFLISESRIKNG